MKMKKLCLAVACLYLLAGILVGCSQSKKEAAKTLEDYLNHIGAAEYAQAYALLSDFDKGNITEDAFTKWQEQAAKIANTTSFSIDSKVDTFKNYKYLGTDFGTVYGLKVDRVQKVLIPDVERIEYDKETFRIMVQEHSDGNKVLLLLTDLDETIAAYDAYLQKPEKR